MRRKAEETDVLRKASDRNDWRVELLRRKDYSAATWQMLMRNNGRIWIEKASRYRSTAWKVSEKQPGYNASDSDSDECEIMLHCSSYPSSIPMAFRGPRPPTSPCV
ncbi:hypothetical protein ACMD2_13784 [Ananas comosus]|uniref:Uncharacterized protein n=1 Tax=Ananas comosus TaxID=4615 RepID=A0A199ULX1_ANACO|nr:hypothetical protein ACMD2_13784 [Ananas comosus]